MIIVTFVILTTVSYHCFCADTCNITIVESIPQDLTYESTAYIARPIWQTWEELIRNSKKYIKINSLYWSMLSNDTTPTYNSSQTGARIFSMLLKKSHTIPIRINQDSQNAACNDMNILRQFKNINISIINVTRLAGNGVQHSKVIIGDGDKAFVGSPNMDWRSLTQIKEIGTYITKCPSIIHDIEAFWLSINLLSGPNAQVPKSWPVDTWPTYNLTNQYVALVNDVPMSMYTASSPSAFNPPHRTDDLTAIVNTIKDAQKFILISVMDFIPMTVNFKIHKETYWPILEDAILMAAIDRQVDVKLLVSLWPHSSYSTMNFLLSLAELGRRNNGIFKGVANLQVKVFIIPAFNKEQREIPFSRVSHSKYMVTESTAYIGTSNWSGNYFNGTIGFSFIAKETGDSKKYGRSSIRQSLEDVFYTDWNSIYTHLV